MGHFEMPRLVLSLCISVLRGIRWFCLSSSATTGNFIQCSNQCLWKRLPSARCLTVFNVLVNFFVDLESTLSQVVGSSKWCSVVKSVLAGQQWPVAVQLFEDLLKDSLQLDLIACNSVVSACEKGGQWQAALGILQHASCRAFRLGAFCFLWRQLVDS